MNVTEIGSDFITMWGRRRAAWSHHFLFCNSLLLSPCRAAQWVFSTTPFLRFGLHAGSRLSLPPASASLLVWPGSSPEKPQWVVSSHGKGQSGSAWAGFVWPWAFDNVTVPASPVTDVGRMHEVRVTFKVDIKCLSHIKSPFRKTAALQLIKKGGGDCKRST